MVCTDGSANVTSLINVDSLEETAAYEYTPFGQLLRSSGEYAAKNPFRFSTKPQDNETRLYDYGLRSYKAEWATWIGRDPLGELGGNNLYAFLGNNPLGDFDILGALSRNRSYGSYQNPYEYFEEVFSLWGEFGSGVYNGGKAAVQGIADLPEVAAFLASKEGRDLLARLATDEDFQDQVLDQLGDELCDFMTWGQTFY